MIATMDAPAVSFSVVVPLFDKRPYLRATIESVRGQSMRPIEIVVVDDGSTDGGAETIADLLGDDDRLIRQPNAGPGAARNTGCTAARGEWIALLDADDLWLDDHLAALSRIIARFPEADVVATGSRWGRDLATGHEEMRIVDIFRDGALRLHSSNVAIRRSAILATAGFSAARAGEDTEYWLRLALDHVLAASNRTTSIYRRDNGGIMDREQARLAAGEALPASPIFATLEAALADPRHAPRHAAIRGYLDRTLLQFARSLVYHGRGREARDLLRRVHHRAPIVCFYLALSCAPPAWLRVAAARYSAAKRMISAHHGRPAP